MYGGAGEPKPGEASDGLTRKQWVTLIVVTLSTFLVLLDASVVNVALPQVVADLGGTLDGATWVVASYILAFAALLLLFGRLGDVFGRRLMFVWGVAVFTLASAACALAPSIGFLVAARVAQGVGAAMLTPSTLSLIKATFPPRKLGFAFGVEGITAGIATAIGPTLGGVLTTSFSWRWVFLMNVPVGILAITAALLAVAESRDETASRRIDVPGALFSGAGVLLLVFALIEGEKLGWGSAAVLASLAASAGLLLAFVLTERRVREPLVDLALFSDRLFAAGNVLRGLVLFVLLGAVFVLPLYWQTQLGYSALRSALVLLPLSIVAFVLSPIAGSLADRVDIRWLVAPGFALAAASAYWLSRFSVESAWTFFVAPLALFGAGLALLLAPTITATLRNVPGSKSGVASGIATASGEIGSAVGLAVVVAVLQNRLLANAEASLAQAALPPGTREGVLAGLAGGGFGEGASPAGGFGLEGPLAARVGGLVRDAFADAVASGLLVVAVAALLGAVLALLFFSSRPGEAQDPGRERGEEPRGRTAPRTGPPRGASSRRGTPRGASWRDKVPSSPGKGVHRMSSANHTRSVRTPVLEVAYEERGPRDGIPVVLVHGFPDDARSWDAVSGALGAAGHRTLAPHLRGFGPTRFLSDDTPRSGQPAALAQDLVEFADALGLERFVLVGHDWGATAAQAVAALHPGRVERLVSSLGYSLTWDTGGEPPSYAQLHALWYQFVLNTPLGEWSLSADRRGFCRYLWEAWSPTWRFSEAEFEGAAPSWDNPDFVAVVLHAYRYGSPFGAPGDEVAGDPRYADTEARLSAGPPIAVPTIVLQGADDGLEPGGPGPSPTDRLFTGGFARRVVEGAGHFPHREKPDAVVEAVLTAPLAAR
jgi:EmrB/QacA subfamily drug resistance transporter